MAPFNQLAARPVYNTRAVVLRTGVPADTFRAWERRYGLPSPVRTYGNQRLYSDRDIAMISWLRDQTRSGLTISHAIELFKSRHSMEEGGEAPFLMPGVDAGNEIPAAPEALARFTRRLVDALVAYDSRSASTVLDEAFDILPLEHVCLQVLQPALYEIGARWQRGEVLISGEHFASAFAIRKLGSFFTLSRPEYGRGPVVATCLEGELHEVGLLMASLFLSRRGYRVIYLGPNLPVADLIESVRDICPPLVLLSASTPESAAAIGRSSHQIKAALSHPGDAACNVEIGYGGRVFVEQPSLQDDVDGMYCGSDAVDAVVAIDAYFAAARTTANPS